MGSKYRPVPEDEEQQTHEKNALLSPLPMYTNIAPFISQPGAHPILIWICHGVLLSFSLAFFALSLLLRASPLQSGVCNQPNFPYSPAESVADFHTVRYNITPALEMSEFVGYGPEVDKAWNHVTYDVGDQMISQAELDKLGLDPKSLKVKDPKTGHTGYRVGIQVFHQLHYHCIEILRNNIMCQSDTGVFAFKYYDGYDGHWPDFSTLHTCRNFDAIRDWAFEHAVVFGDED
ncbi:hypothetical protein FGADI_5763 [Fusarium gaditjirri]|uniref:Uncharacterized protein n=1 Tax=Fusarium gaditjirri TaxID=282569 RepID=A0A8H4T9B7_9HYPO|nr:hypothetical protein FGADI_5763 [Fusarium gaditjirri]